MMRSSPQPSSIAARGPHDEGDRAEGPAAGDSRRRRLGLRLAASVRWLHTYLSMFGLATLLFFSLTGITLNHPRLFFEGAVASVEAEGRLDADWVKGGGSSSDPQAGVKKLEVVEHLRRAHGIRGALASFTTDEDECVVTFK